MVGYEPTYKVEGFEVIDTMDRLYEYGVEIHKRIVNWDGREITELQTLLDAGNEIAEVYNKKIPHLNGGLEVIGIYKYNIPRGYVVAIDKSGNVLYDYKGLN